MQDEENKVNGEGESEGEAGAQTPPADEGAANEGGEGEGESSSEEGSSEGEGEPAHTEPANEGDNPGWAGGHTV